MFMGHTLGIYKPTLYGYLMETFVNADTRQRKQSGTEEEFKAKQLLLESLHDRFEEIKMSKQAAAAAMKKEKEDKERGEKLRQDALQTLKRNKTRPEEDGLSGKKAKFNLEKIWQQKQEFKIAELKLREKELELREHELTL